MSDEQKDKETPKKSVGDEMTNCKVCGIEKKKTKLIMHITRNPKCKTRYGKELDIMLDSSSDGEEAISGSLFSFLSHPNA